MLQVIVDAHVTCCIYYNDSKHEKIQNSICLMPIRVVNLYRRQGIILATPGEKMNTATISIGNTYADTTISQSVVERRRTAGGKAITMTRAERECRQSMDAMTPLAAMRQDELRGNKVLRRIYARLGVVLA